VPAGLRSALSRLDSTGRLLENIILVTLLSGMILLAVGQIVLREVFDTGIIWADQLVRLIVLWLAMMGAMAACREDRHIRIDALSHLFPESVISGIRIVVDLFAAGVCAVIAWHAFRYLQLEIEFEDTVLINTPAWLAHMVLPLAFALVSFRFGIAVFSELHAVISGAATEGTE
jgi:TRAP-type C4-dicarboxylate transport system permease small subunit